MSNTTHSNKSSYERAPAAVAGARFPGHVPGKFYLGMSCGTSCTAKNRQLGQAYGVHRQFNKWADWSGVARNIREDHGAGRLPWVSFKPPGGNVNGWRAISAGKHDAQIRALAATLKANDSKPVLLTFHHEPGNGGTEAQGRLWASAYVRIHDILARAGALRNVADPPILSDWLFNPANRAQDPNNWLTPAVLNRAPFIGVDSYENQTGETFAQRMPRVLSYLARRGHPNMMIGIGESGSTNRAFSRASATDWLNRSLAWAAAHTNDIAVVSYFNSTENSKGHVYWPLDETASKMAAYRGWLNRSVTVE